MLNDYRNKTLRAILSTGYQNMKKLSVEDVTNEYLDKALPNQGSLTRAPGFKEKDHSDEIQVGNFIFSTFGGQLVLLKESMESENPDFEWNNRFWDLKSPNRIHNLGKLVKKGLSQIFRNPGGIIIDVSSLRESMPKIEAVIAERMGTSMKHTVDVMIIKNLSLVKVLRYKK